MEECSKTALRPRLQLPAVAQGNAIEGFQNQVLRPVIKLQHELIIAQLESEQGLLAAVTGTQTHEEHLRATLLWLQRNVPARHAVIGMVVGMLTTDEHTFYLAHSSELSRRIVTMVCQRYADTMRPR